MLCTLGYVAILVLSAQATNLNWTRCNPTCTCAQDIDGNNHASCESFSVTNLDTIPKELYSLTIENTSMPIISQHYFKGLDNLMEMYLRNNSIKIIERDAFETLVNLKIIDLQDNNLGTWEVESAQSLPSLEIIRVAGNKDWVPGGNILRLRRLKQIQGVTWSQHCGECNLIKTTNESEDSEVNETLPTVCHTADFFIHNKKVTYGLAYKFVKLGFSPQCLCYSQRCSDNEVTYPYFRQLNDLPNKLFYFQYVLGILLLCINLIIVVVVLSTRGLRTSSSFILICSMALSDTLIGLYTIGIAAYNPFTSSTVTPLEMMKNDNKACPYLGFVFTTGQTTTVFTSLVLTVERYLAIVHCDKPANRMTAKFTLGLSTVIWLVGILFALLPNFGVKQLQYHKWFQCTMPFHKSSDTPEDTSIVTLFIAIGFVLIYLVSMVLYLRIYVYVRAASANFSVGIQREARLAKRIAVVVCTNFVFFVTPVVLFLVYVYRFVEIVLAVGVQSFTSLQVFIITGSWLPVTLLGINSLLNPILYAFRHQRFQNEIRRISRKLNGNFRESVLSESRLRRNNSFGSPTFDRKSKSRLHRKDTGESTLDIELTKCGNNKV